MHSNDIAFMKSVLQQSMLEHYQEADLKNIRQEAAVNIEKLTEKIGLLPEYMQSLLFMKYAFHVSPATAEDILSLPHAKQKAQYAEALLAYSMGLSDSQSISSSCMEKAAKAALSQWMAEYDIEYKLEKPRYSSKFRKALRAIKTAQKYNNHIALKRTVAAALIAAVSFAMTITANAELRARFFHWLVETFPLFSQFSAVDSSDVSQLNFETMKNMQIGYIPEGFVLTDVFEADPMIVYSYQDASGNTISINANLPTGSPTLFDTENAEIHQVTMNNQTAYWWEKDNTCFLIWQKDGFELNLVGQISYSEALKIAENINF